MKEEYETIVKKELERLLKFHKERSLFDVSGLIKLNSKPMVLLIITNPDLWFAKGYAQKERVDYEETFTLVANVGIWDGQHNNNIFLKFYGVR